MTAKQQARDMPIEDIAELLQQYGSVQAIVQHITGKLRNEGVRAIIADRIRANGLTGLRRENISTRYTPQQLQDAIKTAGCWSDIYRALGLSVCDHNKAGIIRFAEHHGINAPVFTREQIIAAYQRGGGGKATRDAADVYCTDSKHPRSALRSRVVKDGVLGEYVCSKCGLGGEWQGESLRLELDHINGNHSDNRVENLRWLCPNCHTQTPTHKGKNRKK